MVNASIVEYGFYVFMLSAGISFAGLVWYLFRQNRKKDAQIVAKETEVQYQILKGEIDHTTLLDVIKRNNARRRGHNNKGG